MATLAVTAIGVDRPGIIARVTGTLMEHGGNIEDSTMTILGGQFAMVLLVTAVTGAMELEDSLAAATSDLGLIVTVRQISAASPAPPATHLLSVYGTDRPGIVHAITSALATRGVNITDLATRVLEGASEVYAMMLEVRLPDGMGEEELLAAVRADAPDVDVSVHPLHVGEA